MRCATQIMCYCALPVCVDYSKTLKLQNRILLLNVKSSFALLDFYKSPFIVVSKSRYCKLTYSAVRSNFIYIYIYSRIIILFLVSYLLFVFSVIYLVNKSIYIYTLQTQSIDIGIDYRKRHHRTSCCLNISDDCIQSYQIMQRIGNSAECCDDFGSIYFICNMRTKQTRQPYQYWNSKHSQLIAESNSEIIVHLVLWTRRAIEFDNIAPFVE